MSAQASASQRPVSDTFAFSAMAAATNDIKKTTELQADAISNGVASMHPANGIGVDAVPHQRPVSEILPKEMPKSSEAEAIDRWFDDLASYEETMEAMAHASLDQNFKDELSAIEQWFQVLSEAERTATLYSLLQHTTRVQQGFFVAYLQQLIRRENANALKNAGIDKFKNRTRRASSKPHLTITGTNEKYAQMYGEESPVQEFMSPTRQALAGPMTAQPFKENVSRTPGLYNARPKTAQLGALSQQSQRWSQNGVTTTPAVHVGSLEESVTPNKWQPLTPTFSTFSEMAKTIERPRSAADADRTGAPTAGGVGLGSAHNLLNGKNWPQSAKLGQVFAARAPLGPPPPGGEQERNFMSRPFGSARTPTGKFMLREPHTADPNRMGGMRALVSPALPPGLFPGAAPTSPASITMHHWDPNPKKSTMLRDFSAGLLSDGRLMETKVGSKEAAAISRLLSNKTGKLGQKDAKKRASSENGDALGDKAAKGQEPVDFALMNDIPAWFRSMRLHKYTTIFETMSWRELVKMDDQELSNRGVAALGARRKMLKVFESVLAEAEVQGITL